MRKAALCGLFSYIDELVNLTKLSNYLKKNQIFIFLIAYYFKM